MFKHAISQNMSPEAASIVSSVGNVVLQISLHIIDTGLPIWSPTVDVDRQEMHYNNPEDDMYRISSGSIAKSMRKFHRQFLWWKPINQVLFTETERRKLDKRFDHPYANKL